MSQVLLKCSPIVLNAKLKKKEEEEKGKKAQRKGKNMKQ